jgi:hypothetical protein
MLTEAGRKVVEALKKNNGIATWRAVHGVYGWYAGLTRLDGRAVRGLESQECVRRENMVLRLNMPWARTVIIEKQRRQEQERQGAGWIRGLCW